MNEWDTDSKQGQEEGEEVYHHYSKYGTVKGDSEIMVDVYEACSIYPQHGPKDHACDQECLNRDALIASEVLESVCHPTDEKPL